MKVPIRIYNKFLDFEGEIDTYQSLQFGRSFHSIADFELHVNRYMHEAKKLTKGDIIGLGKQANKAAIILTKEIALNENGKETENFKLTGCTLDGLMIRRIIVPPSHTAYDRKSGNAETVMKHYVMNHFVNPVNPDRKMPHIEVAPNQKRGAYIDYESRFTKTVAEVLEDISIKSGLGWGIFANFKTKKLIFDVIEAKDLTQGNPYGYDPVFFSPEFDTIKSQSFVDSDKDLKTVGYVGGQGEGINRQIITVGSKTGWDRIETFIDARDVGDSEDKEQSPEEIEQQLIERGQSKMSDMETLRSLEAEIKTPVKDVTPFQYEKHYDLGDKVQVVNKSWGLTMEAPITEFQEIHEPTGFRLEATFGRSRPTLISKIKDKFNELDGIEKQELPAQIAVETRKYTDQEVYKEEQERIEQSKENLEASKNFTKDYAEKKRVESSTEPEDKDVIWVDTSDPDNVVWKIWSEAEGKWKAGPGGPQGIPGPPGENGQTLYTWLKYADDESGTGISDSPTNKAYIGLSYNNTSSVESMNPSDYTWSKIEGEKGDTGVQGPPGENGQPTYTWVKYADTVTGDGFSDSPDNKEYIGLAYNKTTSDESSNPDDYAWSKIKGEKGDRGPQGEQGIQGPKGENGQPTYTWIKYANNASGSGMSNSPSGKEYIGIATNKTTPTESSNASDYNWSLIKGPKGEQGPQGIEGPRGEEGQPRYTWVRYADDSAGNGMSNYPDGKDYIGLAHNKTTATEGTNPADYTWSKIKGPQGPNIVDTNTSFGVAWLIADYIKSLNGLNINDQFVIDDDGNVSIGNDRITIKVGGSNVGINVRNGIFTLEDDVTSMPYNVTPQRNLVKDHSFELAIPDHGSMGSGSVKYNWLEMNQSGVPTENFWTKSGSPKVAVVFGPNDRSALPIFGEQAIVVRDGDFVRQTIADGIAAGMTFAVTGHFKRQHNVVGGGTPRFEIDHQGASGDFKARLTNTIFPAVNDDYSISRHSLIITIPNDFAEGDSLDFKISGGNTEWVQCDGVQIVEGDTPSVYMPEDATWELVKGNYPSILKQPPLWKGAVYLDERHTIRPDKPLGLCQTGWMLKWSFYEPGTGVSDTDWQYTIVPKTSGVNGRDHRVYLRAGNDREVFKYFHVYNDRLVGHSLSSSGNNGYMALREVLEF
ncbi:Gp37-like protein [Virgibacillus salexigens]|uniref:Gp28/Gp37-like domain-containing protein n=1 Tax=Virgibacillus kapii TaxID=1638645 RepID=A0ABQ2DLF0_9BACI|nr:hypothetical protein [Virgibacillus kapii]GGJ62082.1 hypothetical protein GCM10007111_25250 [Virgibacillus kapii]